MTDILCQHCKKGHLVLMTGDEPYNGDHYQCSECDSTYPVDFQRRNLSIDYWLENTNNIYAHQQNDYHVSSIIIDAFEAGYDSRNKEISDLREKYNRLLEFVAEGCPYRCYYEGNHPSCDSLECDVLREINEGYQK